MEKKTGYKLNDAGVIWWIFFWIIAVIPIIIFAIRCYISVQDIDATKWAIVLISDAIMIMLALVEIRGRAKAKKQLKKEQKLLEKDNPYIYFRELPNSFGIGVTSLLFDSTLENEKDIVAVILDLCARKYLRLEKQLSGYSVRVLKGADEHLLSNEKYILDLVINNKIAQINYTKWFDYCVKDGTDLGLYVRNSDKVKDTSGSFAKKCFKVYSIIVLIFMVLGFLAGLTQDLTEAIKYVLIALLTGVVIVIPLFIVVALIVSIKGLVKESTERSLHNNLKQTPKGIDELHKLFSFKAFIKDFGNFVEKSAEEVVLWDRYLSYAQVFGLTDEIMKNGYKELVNNASFNIDSIDNISLSAIETV